MGAFGAGRFGGSMTDSAIGFFRPRTGRAFAAKIGGAIGIDDNDLTEVPFADLGKTFSDGDALPAQAVGFLHPVSLRQPDAWRRATDLSLIATYFEFHQQFTGTGRTICTGGGVVTGTFASGTWNGEISMTGRAKLVRMVFFPFGEDFLMRQAVGDLLDLLPGRGDVLAKNPRLDQKRESHLAGVR